MQFLDDIKNETLIICNDNDKKNILLYKKMKNIKIMTLPEFISKICFEYDEETILYVMNKYNIKYSVANTYIKNLYYIENKKYNIKKLDFLVELKNDLDNRNLLKYNCAFKKYVQSISVIVYGIRLTKFELNLLKDIPYKYISKEYKKYDHDIFCFQAMEEEIEYVAFQICSLLDKGISPLNIKITNVDSSYYNTINRIFSLFGLKTSIQNKISLASFSYIKEFINIYNDNDLDYAINNIDKNDILYNELIKVINKYIRYNNKELIIYKLENTYINSNNYNNAIEIINYLEYTPNDLDYVFMIGFNDGIIPNSYKDTDYITDNIKCYVDIDTSNTKNEYLREDIIKIINGIKNLTITYKLRDIKRSFYPSTLCDLYNVVNMSTNSNISYSEVYNKIKLTKSIDNYIKYGYKDKDFSILYNNFKVNYNSYDNSYKMINRVMDRLNLSYSKMQIYNKCAFRYYLTDILKLDVFEENFSTIIGSMVHYVLEKCLSNNDKNIDKYVSEYLSDRVFTNKEKFFLEKYKICIGELLEQIDLEKEFGSFDNALYEKKIVIDYGDNVKFTGIIDKVLYKEENYNTYVALIDYKTGNDDINLKYLYHGINMQLPIYLYLSNYLNLRNVIYSGFYLQKFNIVDKDYRLIGYSNSDKDILSIIDKNYNNSKIIKGMKTLKNGEFSSYSKVLSNDDIDKIKEITRDKIYEVITNIKNNKFDINPKVSFGVNIGCEYCKYKDICFVKKKDTVEIDENLVGSDLSGLY